MTYNRNIHYFPESAIVPSTRFGAVRANNARDDQYDGSQTDGNRSDQSGTILGKKVSHRWLLSWGGTKSASEKPDSSLVI